MDDRLFRSRDDRMLAGVAGGLAELWDVDPSLIRIIWAVLVPFTGGIALLVYIVMAVVVPEEPSGSFPPFGAMPPAEPSGPPPSSTAQPAGPAGSGWTVPDGSRQEARAARMEARAARRAARRAGGGSGSGALIGGLILVALGLFFLAREWLPALDFDWVWPVILVGIGVVLLLGALRRGPGEPGGSGGPR